MARNCGQLPTQEEVLAHTWDLFLFSSAANVDFRFAKRAADRNTDGSALIAFLDTDRVVT